jgi:tRNA A22 N-methylase
LVDPSLDVFKSLKDSYITNGKINLINKKGQDLKIETKNNLFFIAGMGGKEIGGIIQSLLPHLQSCSRFVISPHRKILELRSLLRELPLKLEKEEVVWDKGQFYVVLSLKPDITGEKKVSLFGDELWQSETGEHYRQQQIQFFSLHKDEKSQQYIDFLRERKPPSSP